MGSIVSLSAGTTGLLEPLPEIVRTRVVPLEARFWNIREPHHTKLSSFVCVPVVLLGDLYASRRAVVLVHALVRPDDRSHQTVLLVPAVGRDFVRRASDASGANSPFDVIDRGGDRSFEVEAVIR